MKFHEKLYTLRKNANMTQTDLAEKLNVSRQAVSRWEMGTSMPDVTNLIAMSDLFSVTLDDLLKNQEDVPEGARLQQREGGPRYWDFLPSKWWVFAVLAVVCKLLSFVPILLIMNVPRMAMSSVAWIPLLNTISGLSLGLLAACFIWALYQWLKVRK